MSSKKKPLHNNFRDYTKEEVDRIKKEVCFAHKCPYISKLPTTYRNGIKQSSLTSTCDYFLVTGKRRGCMPDLCKHYEDKIDKKEIAATRKRTTQHFIYPSNTPLE